MSNKTSNYGLTKPLPEEFYDIDVQNQNMDIIDDALVNKKHPMSMGGHKITDVAEPTNGSDVATRNFVEKHSIAGNTYVAVDYENDGHVILKPYVADEDELVFRDHIANKTNPHKVTPEQIGAFPTVTVIKSNFDINDYTENGLFYFSSSYTATNAPENVTNGWFQVMTSAGGGVKQILYRAGKANTTDFHTYVRSYVSETWSGWKRFTMIENKIVTGSTNNLGNIALGVTAGTYIPTAVESSDGYIVTTFAKNGQWYGHITDTDGTTTKASTNVTLTCYYLAL